jgi:hypothetical protein
MSWSEHFPNHDANEEFSPSTHTESNPWHLEQFQAARWAADDLIDSGVVGDADKFLFSVSLSGHGNENHEPAEGWANDAITVSIYQAGPKEAGDGGEG